MKKMKIILVSFLFLFNLGLFSGIVSPTVVLPVTSGNVLMASESVIRQPNIIDSQETTEVNNDACLLEFKATCYVFLFSILLGMRFMFMTFEDFFAGLGFWR